jgi:hypothetical protein
MMRTNTDSTTTAAANNAGGLIRAWRSRTMHFLRHYTEMVVAMFLGMFVLGLPLAALLGVAGVDVSAWRTDARELLLLGMAFTMSVPMAAWMRYRGHGWAPVWEMTGSMFVPSFVAIAPAVGRKRAGGRRPARYPAHRDVPQHAGRDAAARRVHRPRRSRTRSGLMRRRTRSVG